MLDFMIKNKSRILLFAIDKILFYIYTNIRELVNHKCIQGDINEHKNKSRRKSI